MTAKFTILPSSRDTVSGAAREIRTISPSVFNYDLTSRVRDDNIFITRYKREGGKTRIFLERKIFFFHRSNGMDGVLLKFENIKLKTGMIFFLSIIFCFV